MIAVPELTSSSASLPLTMNAFENSRWPLIEIVPGFRPPEGESALTPTSCCVLEVSEVAGTTPGCSASKIRVAAAVQGHGGHLRAADHLAHLRIGRFRVNGAFAHRDRFRSVADFQRPRRRSTHGSRRWRWRFAGRV